jgi:hypothetical protein
MRLILAIFVAGVLVAQNPQPQKRLFSDVNTTAPGTPTEIDWRWATTVTIIADQEGVLPLLRIGPNVEADTAIIDIFYRYETSAFNVAEGRPAKLLLSVRVTCPVLAGIDSGCDYAPQRTGFSLEAIEFVRVKFLRTTREIDHMKPQ